jgi:hypothetical protein
LEDKKTNFKDLVMIRQYETSSSMLLKNIKEGHFGEGPSALEDSEKNVKFISSEGKEINKSDQLESQFSQLSP